MYIYLYIYIYMCVYIYIYILSNPPLPRRPALYIQLPSAARFPPPVFCITPSLSLFFSVRRLLSLCPSC